jgi:hypothetical protein
MKKGILIAVAAIVAAFSVAIVGAKTVGVLYGDGLTIPYNGTTTASVSSAGVASFASLDVVGALTVATLSPTKFTLPSMSSTTIKTYVPAVGELVYNSTRFAVCVGTAATAGSLIFQSSNPITTAGVSCEE